jgi:hypothetical protein
MRSRPAIRFGPGTVDESFEGQHGCGSRIVGQAVPGVWGLARVWAEVRIDLAGDVTLQTADCLFLGHAFLVRRSR